MPQNADLILTVALGYEEAEIRRFLSSLRRQRYDGTLALFVDEHSQLPSCIENNERILYLKVRAAPEGPPRQVVLERYFYYQEFLKNFDRFDRCLITDCRDVIFQRSPFDFCGWDRFNFFYALEERVIGDCSMNARWIAQRYGMGILHTMAGEVISCAGTVYGKKDAIRNYVSKMCSHLENAPKIYGLDMAAHNYIIRQDRIEGQRAFLNGLSPIMTIHYMAHESIQRTLNGEFANYDGTLPNLVHQYDRITKDMAQKFSILDFD